ncbi:MAG: hypothetical protein QXU98_06540 [Candidatus Parvarchaeota archaeon]
MMTLFLTNPPRIPLLKDGGMKDSKNKYLCIKDNKIVVVYNLDKEKQKAKIYV